MKTMRINLLKLGPQLKRPAAFVRRLSGVSEIQSDTYIGYVWQKSSKAIIFYLPPLKTSKSHFARLLLIEIK